MWDLRGELFEAVAAVTPAAVLATDADGLIFSWNAGAAHLYGYRADEAMGTSIRALWPDDLDFDPSGTEAELQAGRSVKLRTRRRHRNGHFVPVQMTLFPVTRSGVGYAGAVSIARDLATQLTETESAQAETARLNALMRYSFDAVLACDPDGTITDAVLGAGSSVWESLPPDLVGQSGWDFLHPDEIPQLAENWEGALSTPFPQAPVLMRVRAVDGSWLWVEQVLSNALQDPNVGAMIVNLRDVTERVQAEQLARRNEERHRRAVQDAPDAIAIVDSQGVISLANAELGRLVDQPLSALTGITYQELGLPAEATELKYARFDAAGDGTNPRWLEVTTTVLPPTEPGDVEQMIWLHDVTEQVADEQRLIHEGRMDAMRNLAAGVAHDFNNLLQLIQGHAELLGSCLPADSEEVSDVEAITEATHRAADLVDQLMSLARGQALQPTAVRLHGHLDQVAAFCRRLLPAGISLSLDCADGDPYVYMDPHQLDRVVINLVTNARDAIAGAGHITIGTADAPPRASQPAVRLFVADDGTGMTPATAARCMEPFFTTKPPGIGTGLGLPTVFGLVEQSGGTVAVDTGPGKGTRVDLTLPVTTPPPEETHTRAAATSKLRGPILIVDDDDQLRLRLVRLVSSLGYAVEYARSAEIALDLAKDGAPTFALLISDVRLPGMDGVDLAQQMLEQNLVRDAILMSGFVGGRTEEWCRRTGTPLLRKPFRTSQLYRLLHDRVEY